MQGSIGATMVPRHGAWRKAALVAGAGVGAVAATAHLTSRHRHPSSPAKFYLPRPLMDGLAGAVGEVAQICVLYPLETIKVRCQADGMSAAQVVRAMLAKHGASLAMLRSLYSGFSASAYFSLAVGAVHWLSFCAAKRSALEMLPQPQQIQKQEAAVQAVAAVAAVPGKGEALVPSVLSHAPDGHLADTAYSDADLAHRTSANAVAAMIGALCTALVESPAELFRHQAQAGMISGNLVQEMSKAVRTGGPLALWAGFVPFLIEAFPYDMSELMFYSQIRDTYDAASRPGGRLASVKQWLPEHAVDLAMGGAAGAVAVLLSMPFDVIKTYLQTRDMGTRFQGLRGQTGLFVATGMKMVKRRGLGALYVGTLPRLVQQVPSSTVCWWAVQQTQKLTEPFTEPTKPSSAAATSDQ